ncbi:MAG TPA: PD-(D/E)XK nuclease family protein [Candidatus Binatia bacterium]|nr:PD-(D/E)XK nuclease family protein [Candidatus Binatia bacterium]
MACTCVPLGSAADAFAHLIEWLPSADAPLARRATILCRSTRAHVLRRAVAVERGQPGRLAGVSFLDPVVLAHEVLVRSGAPRERGWEAVRRLRIHLAFHRRELRQRLQYFDADQLRSGRGYADAFARVIEELEGSGLDPRLTEEAATRLRASDSLAGRRLHDVAAVWSAVDADRGTRCSVAQLLTDAAAALHADPRPAQPFGAIAAFLTSSPSAVLLRFLDALPDCTIVFLDARPLRTGTQRWRASVVSPPATHTSPAGESARNELALAQRYLFMPSDVAADPARPRSAGPDGSVDFEAYPSVEDELQAAALWVEEQIAAGIPLEQIALVVPALDPHARLLIDRLARLDTTDTAPINVVVAGGVPFIDSPAGLRLCTVLEALARGLEAEATIALLPSLRRAGDAEGRSRLSPSRTAEIVYGAGIVGGSPTHSNGALEWLPRLQQRREALQQALSELPASDTEPEKRRHLFTRRDTERWLADVEPMLAPIESLQNVAAAVIAGEPLRTLWPMIREFVGTQVVMPPLPVNALGLVDDALDPILAEPLAEEVRGVAAVTWLLDAGAGIRIPHGRIGEPAVFVGTAEQAAGIPFRAVRVLGLAEGIVPGTPHDDPIVPNDIRVRLEELLQPQYRSVVVPRLEDRVLEDLHAFFRIVTATSDRLALSASRQWIDRSEREVSGVMLEVAAAVARRSDGSSEGDVPNAARLRAAYYAPGLAARDDAAERSLQTRARLTRAPHREASDWRVPSNWCEDSANRLDRVHALVSSAPAAPTGLDGFLTAAWPSGTVPGLSRERPISASALGTLLQCPHRFLWRYILNFSEPAARPSTDAIDPPAYGSLFHRVAEAFFRRHGAELCAHDRDLDEWQRRARHVAVEQFEIWRAEYPLRGDDAVERERHRLVRQIERLVEIEWEMTKRTFVAAEQSFGDPTPVTLSVPGGELYVAGQIDRVDRWGTGKLSVRDLKTGRVHDFQEEPVNPARDLQIGLYVLALEAESAHAAVVHAAYVHPSAAQQPERRFEHSDLTALRDATRTWLGIARGLLAAGTFPRTPEPSDCTYCPFQPTCGKGAQERSAAQLAKGELSPEVRAFVRMKQEGHEDAA